LKHFLVMILFAALVAVVFGVLARNTVKERVTYGLKVFAEFVGIGLALAWVLYFFPF
jgi:undecaprenyl pyrophosphate phosphatase UppP